jgi:hypothetical protein
VTYAGARSLVSLADALEIGGNVAFEPKIDGVYSRVYSDAGGAIARIHVRSGAVAPPKWTAGLIGLPIGLPSAVLHGEIEASTEAGERVAAARGWRALHVFDVSSIGRVDLEARPYRERYDALRQWQDGTYVADWWRVDDQGDAHGPDGRYVRPVPQDLRRLPIVPMVRGRAAAEALWHQVETGQLEGMVVVRLDSAMGKRGAKRKVKPADTIDAVVVDAGGGAAVLAWRGYTFAVQASGAAARGLRAGDVVEVKHNGWYERKVEPRFARIVRVRTDLATMAA